MICEVFPVDDYSILATGSREFGDFRDCEPDTYSHTLSVPESDYDFVIYTPNLEEVSSIALCSGFVPCSDEKYGCESSRYIFRKGLVNIIAESTLSGFLSWVCSTSISKELGLSKAQRPILFEAVRDYQEQIKGFYE